MAEKVETVFVLISRLNRQTVQLVKLQPQSALRIAKPAWRGRVVPGIPYFGHASAVTVGNSKEFDGRLLIRAM